MTPRSAALTFAISSVLAVPFALAEEQSPHLAVGVGANAFMHNHNPGADSMPGSVSMPLGSLW